MVTQELWKWGIYDDEGQALFVVGGVGFFTGTSIYICGESVCDCILLEHGKRGKGTEMDDHGASFGNTVQWRKYWTFKIYISAYGTRIDRCLVQEKPESDNFMWDPGIADRGARI